MIDDKKFCGVDCYGNWVNVDYSLDKYKDYWRPADMQEVKKLLIKEAEKRGFKEGVNFTTPVTKLKRKVHSNPFINHTQEGLCVDAGIFGTDTSIFDFKTGKWAEIVEKPLKYVIKLTETTKAFPKETFYKCEVGSMLNDTENKSEAFIFEHFEGAERVKDFIEESYDFKAEIVDYK